MLQAIRDYAEAYRIIQQHRLWLWVLLPGIFSLILGLTLIYFGYLYSDEAGEWVSSFWKWEFGKQVVETTAQVISILLLIAVNLLIYKYLVLIMSAPFTSPLSERVEKILTGNDERTYIVRLQFLADILRGIRINLRNISREILLTIFIFLLGLIPIVSPFTAFLLFFIQAYYAGFGSMDYYMERHESYRGSIQYVHRNRSTAVGNGTVFLLLLGIPVIGLILAPGLSAAAATVSCVRHGEV